MKKQDLNIKIPDSAKTALEKLENAGFTAYVVGGYIRDQIRGEAKAPQDIDIATSATPEEIEQVFACSKGAVYPLGKKFGTIGFQPNGENQTIEITTYRTEETYSDGRHPDEVSFATSIEEDLARRDFTCNAIACDINGNLVDPYNGIEDIHNDVIRCVGNPVERFNEDHLRILRALRFASQLGFKIDEATETAVRDLKPTINNVSAERIREEMTKLLCGKNARQVLTIYSDVVFEVLPELKPLYKFDQKTKYHSHDAWEHTLIVVDKMKPSEIGRWAALLHDIGKPDCQTFDEDGQGHYYGHPKVSVEIAKPILRRLKFSNIVAESILLLVRYHDQPMAATKKSVKKMLRKFAEVNTELPTNEMFRMYCDLRRADSYAHDENYREYLTFTDEIEKVFEEVIAEDEAFSLKDLKIKGTDVINLGVEPGPRISEILNSCLDAVVNEEIKNENDKLLEYIKSELIA